MTFFDSSRLILSLALDRTEITMSLQFMTRPCLYQTVLTVDFTGQINNTTKKVWLKLLTIKRCETNLLKSFKRDLVDYSLTHIH